MKASLTGGLAAFLMGLAACATAPQPPLSLVPPGPAAPPWQDWDWTASAAGDEESPDGVWTGIFLDRSPNDAAGVAALEASLGRKFAVQVWFADFSQGFPADEAELAWKSGTVPSITWEPWLWTDKERIHLDDINAGRWDAYIENWGRGAAAFGKPVFVRWGHEFNGDWYPWAVSKNGEDPAAYVKAYRRVHDLVARAGARNVLWVWCPNAASVPQQAWNNPMAAYPGDDVVDWVGLDGYDFDGTAAFADIFSRIYSEVVKGTEKPVYIGETATGRTGAAKASYLRDMHEALATKFPGIKGLVWFNVKKEREWRLEDSPASLAAAAEIFGLPLYRSGTDSIPVLAGVYDQSLTQYREQAKALTAVARSQLVLPLAAKTASGIDWSRTAVLPVKGASGPIGELNFAWDKERLYLRAVLRTGRPMNNPQTGDGIWNGDGIEFCVSINPKADPDRGYFDTTDWQIGVSPGTPGQPARTWEWSKIRAQVPGATAQASATAEGWTVEASIPWKALGGFEPEAGMVLGFDAAVDLAGADGTRASQWIWNGNSQFYNNPVQWGTLALGQ